MKKTTQQAIEELKSRTARSAWSRGVTEYAIDLLTECAENINAGYYSEPQTRAELEKLLLNGAESWSQYSWGGSALIYDYDIARRLCTPSELRRTRDGDRRPNSCEEWLDVQARALYQACRIIKNILF